MTSSDPIRDRRAQVDRMQSIAQRIGYLLFLVAIVLFLVGFAAGFTDFVVSIIVASMVIGSLLLAPAIVLGYAVKAAEREDRERGL